MSDKLKAGISVDVDFVAGESPTAPKLSAITSQLRNAARELEKAVGDVRDQSYPYSITSTLRLSTPYGSSDEVTGLPHTLTRPLDIVNLARLIGPASALNPQMLSVSPTITENVPAGVYSFSLRYPTSNAAGVSFSNSGAGQAFLTRRIIASTISAAGDYHVDSNGQVFTTQATDATTPGTVTYDVDVQALKGGNNYLGGRYNSIPGPNQLTAGGAGVTVGSLVGDRRNIQLPVATHAQYDVEMDDIQLSDADINYNQQLKLPVVLTENLTSGDTIPEGFLYLKNFTTNEVYESATYHYVDEMNLEISGVDVVTAGNVFGIITVGSDITTAIDDLRRKSHHSHDRTFGEPMVPADSICNWTAGPWDASKGGFTTSSISSNYAPQYLHRYGWQSSENNWNDNNAMRGDVVLGLSSGSPGSFIDSSGSHASDDTFKLGFGHPDNASVYLSSGSILSFDNVVAAGLYAYDFDAPNLTSNGVSFKIGSTGYSLNHGNVWVQERPLASTLLEGWERHYGRAYFFHAERFSGGAGYSPTPAFVPTPTNGSSPEYDFTFVGYGTGASYFTTVISAQNSVKGVLQLHYNGSDSDNVRFVEFLDNTNPDTLGRIQSSASGSSPVFASVTPQLAVDGTGSQIDVPSGGGVQYISGHSDFGEYFEAGNPEEWPVEKFDEFLGIPEGTIVYVYNSKFWKDNIKNSLPMVVTYRAFVVGNAAVSSPNSQILSFAGQVPVVVLGSAKSGDLLVPHDEYPQVTKAIDPEGISFADYRRAVGTVIQTVESDDDNFNLVLTAIGKK